MKGGRFLYVLHDFIHGSPLGDDGKVDALSDVILLTFVDSHLNDLFHKRPLIILYGPLATLLAISIRFPRLPVKESHRNIAGPFGKHPHARGRNFARKPNLPPFSNSDGPITFKL